MTFDRVKFDRVRLAALADYLAAAAVVSLPWSTSATSILVPLWAAAAAAAATFDGAPLRRMAATPAAVLPVALAVLAVVGTLWSDISWPARLSGISPFLKLLVIPLLFIQFSRTGHGELVFRAFLASAGALLLVSWLIFLFPQIPWKARSPGVPVKDYIIQSIEFALCGLVLLDRAIAAWGKSRATSALLAGLALLFLGNIVFVVLGRTAIVIIAVLYGMLALRHFERRALAISAAAGIAIAILAWSASPYLRDRVTHLVAELDSAHADLRETSAGVRVGLWKMSIKAISGAPLFGHGTGSIAPLFTRMAAEDPDAPLHPTNPHNQIFTVAIQLGVLGAAVLLLMWVAHLWLFLQPGPTAWIGLSVVAENVVGSLFNSHLSDFSHGWLYVFGVGVAGGVMLREQVCERTSRPAETAPAVTPALAATAAGVAD